MEDSVPAKLILSDAFAKLGSMLDGGATAGGQHVLNTYMDVPSIPGAGFTLQPFRVVALLSDGRCHLSRTAADDKYSPHSSLGTVRCVAPSGQDVGRALNGTTGTSSLHGCAGAYGWNGAFPRALVLRTVQSHLTAAYA
jgi:hypothetical protein